MPRERNFRADYERRNELAKLRGFSSYGQQRRSSPQIRNDKDLGALPPDAREQRERSLRALSEARNNPNLSLTEAAASAGTSVEAISYFAGPALERRDGRLSVKSGDRLYRSMKINSGGQTVIVDVRGSRKATLVAEYHLAVNQYLATGEVEGLRRFEGKSVGGRTLETNPDVLDDLGRRGELNNESIYKRFN